MNKKFKLKKNSIYLKYFVIIYTNIQKSGVSNIFSFFLFFKVINTFIQQGCVKLIKNDSKDLYRILNKYCSF